MKTLYLHIGTPKTATSTIQAFLEENTGLLEQQGCAFPIFSHKYPHVKQVRNAHFLFLNKESLCQDDPPEPTQEWRDRLKECLGIIEEEFEKRDCVLLTDENLWWSIFYAPLSFLQILPAFAAEKGYVFKVVVYLRRQDSLMESLYKSKVKGAKTSLSMKKWYEHHRRKFPNYLNYERTLQEIADAVGRENVIVRRFDASFWKDHSVCMDFLDAIGLDTDLPYTCSEEVLNAGLKGNMVELQRIVNGMDFELKEKYQFAEFTKQLSDQREDQVPYYVFTEEETRRLLDHYREGNDRVAQIYIGDGKPLFSDAIEAPPVWEQNNDLMTTDLVRFFASSTNDLYREVKNLKKEIRRVSRENGKLKTKVEKLERQDQERPKSFTDVLRRRFGKKTSSGGRKNQETV